MMGAAQTEEFRNKRKARYSSRRLMIHEGFIEGLNLARTGFSGKIIYTIMIG